MEAGLSADDPVRYRCLSFLNPRFRSETAYLVTKTTHASSYWLLDHLETIEAICQLRPSNRLPMTAYLYIRPFSIVLVDSGAFGERGILAMAFPAVVEEGVE